MGIVRIRTSKVFNFYGNFEMGAMYDMKNFNNMLVNTFSCFLDSDSLKKFRKDSRNSLLDKQSENECTLVLTDDSIIIFDVTENPQVGKLIFWSTLYSIIDAQVN